MKKIFGALLCAACLCFAVAFADGIDLSAMTDEELIALHGEVSQQVAFRKSGEIVYDEDGITITWVGMAGDKNAKLPNRFGIIVGNATGKDYYFAVTAGGINGIKLDLVTNRGTELVESGIGYYTGGQRRWLFDENVLKQLNITHADTIYLHIDFFEEKQTNKWSQDDVVRTIKISFPVNFDIP